MSAMGRFAGRVALITGAGRGLGRAIATRLAAEGASVAVADIDLALAREAALALETDGARAIALAGDVGNERDAARFAHETRDALGRIDILVNNAGIAPNRLLRDQTLEEWDRVLRVNLTGAFLCSKAVLPAMEHQGGGRIVNIASISGQRGSTGRSAYGVSKAGLIQLTRLMAVEFAPLNIFVNAVAPGPVQTALTDNSAAATQAYLDRIPLRRFGHAEAVAAAVAFLASDEASNTTGHILNVDGGFDAAGLIFDQGDLRPA